MLSLSLFGFTIPNQSCAIRTIGDNRPDVHGWILEGVAWWLAGCLCRLFILCGGWVRSIHIIHHSIYVCIYHIISKLYAFAIYSIYLFVTGNRGNDDELLALPSTNITYIFSNLTRTCWVTAVVVVIVVARIAIIILIIVPSSWQ